MKQKFFRYYDFVMLFMTLGLALFGVMMIYSSSYAAATRLGNPYRFIKQQLIGLVLGFIAMILIGKVDYNIYKKRIMNSPITLASFAYVVAIILQILVLFVGSDYNGAKRWIEIGPIQFQPAELTKIAVILYVAECIEFNQKNLDNIKGFTAIMLRIAIPCVLVAKENLSSAIIIAGIGVGMCFIAGRKKIYYFVLLIIGGIAGAAYIFLGEGFRSERIDIWLHIETHEKGDQIRQGLYALATGGLFGKGLGRSMQKLGHIPEAYNDMIFTVICEELGVVGASILIIAFIVFIWRIAVIATHTPNLYGTLICIGVMLQVSFQFLFNIAVVTNTIPSTGVALPFISYGGTSVIILMAEMGLVLNASRQIRQKE